MLRPYEKVYHVKKKKEWGVCPCGKEPITNKHYGLCVACMFEKKHGMTLKEYAKIQKAKSDERAKERAKLKPATPSVKKRLPFFSEKGKARDGALKVTRSAVLKKALDSNSLHCAGCGCVSGLTNSHILSKALRPDLFDIVDNVQLLCLKCHFYYENGTIEEKCNLKSFVDACKYIFKNDMPRFEAILYKLSDAYQKTGNKTIEGVMKKLERFE